MLKKIILPVVLLMIFTQQDFYGMKSIESEYPTELEIDQNRKMMKKQIENLYGRGIRVFYDMEKKEEYSVQKVIDDFSGRK